nr:hypothetical protein [Rhodoferax sp.]
MKRSRIIRGLLLSMFIGANIAAAPAFAQVSFNISIAPPAPLYEVAPAVAPGYIWVPGYWAWNVDRHVWIRGRTVVQRVGYRWEPDRWEQRDRVYYRYPGRWERDVDYKVIKVKKEKKSKHWDNNDDHDGPGNGKSRKQEH